MKSKLYAALGVGALGTALVLIAPTVAQQPPSAAATQTVAEPTAPKYNVDVVHSHIVFSILHMGVGTNWGRFNEFSGTIHFDPENLAGSRIHVAVNTASVDTRNERRDRHVRTADFFNVEQFATAEFVSDKITHVQDNMYQVSGTLTFMGVSKPLTAPFRYNGKAEGRRGALIGGDAEFVFKPGEHGMPQSQGLGSEVRVFVSLEAGEAREGDGQGTQGQRRPGGGPGAGQPGGQGREGGQGRGARPNASN